MDTTSQTAASTITTELNEHLCDAQQKLIIISFT